ncbi:hypothetical protein A9Q98_05415 [Thalassotalea sp. 42_200_T64]|nr:hypothetical protein A9Q98_05415 [Thalassotalea sp. 42_200_T64]
MHNISLILVLAMLSAGQTANASDGATDATAKHLTTITVATPIERKEPKYPKREARNRREGWVQLSFVVEKDGSVSSPIIENSSGSRSFEKAAKRAVKQWKYEPAVENGEPIQQCLTTVQLDFRLSKGGVDSVSSRFNSIYQDVTKKIQAKDVENIDKQFIALKKQSNVTGERMRYALARGHYAGLIENHKLQRKSYSRALHEGKGLLKDDYKLSLLKQIHYLDLEFNDLTSAIDTAQKII